MAQMIPKFRYGETVYHVCDPEQRPLIITGVVHRGDIYTYLAANSESEKECSDIELTSEKLIF